MLIISILFQLLSNVVTLRRDKSVLYTRTALNILIYCIYSNFLIRKSIKAIGLFGGLFHFTSVTKIFQIFFYIICAIILQLTAYYPRKILEISSFSVKQSLYSSFGSIKGVEKGDNYMAYKSFIINKMSEQFKNLEYSLIILFVISGAIFLMSSSDLISMFLSIELQSYGLYILSTIYKNSESSTKGGLTYFLLGGLSSCFILLGSCLLYSNTATTNLDGIYVITSLTSNSSDLELLPETGLDGLSSLSMPMIKKLQKSEANYINISLIIMTVGFLFKVSAAPFHFWSPDVYDAIPTIVTTFVAIVGKISIFVFLLELLHYTGRNFLNLPSFDSIALLQTNIIEKGKVINEEFIASDLEFSWINVLLVSCLLSLIIGTVLGLTQNRIKRLFAYSTISHIGFILLALSIDSVESIQAFLFYLMQYSLTNLNAFFILISIGYTYYLTKNVALTKNLSFAINFWKKELKDQNNSPIQYTKQLKGLFYVNALLALSLAITIFSFAGIPPLIGFFGKQIVLSAALDSGYYFLAIVAILTSVISAVYYLNIIKEIFFYKLPLKSKNIKSLAINPENDETRTSSFYPLNDYKYQVALSSYLTITISVITLGIVLFIFFPKEWLSMVNVLTLNLNNT